MSRKADILIIEDNPGDWRLTKEALTAGGWANEPYIAPDGLEALNLLQRMRPDLILLDLGLPRMNGFQFLGALKANPDWKDIPVVVLTSSEDTDDRRVCSELGADCFLTKPTDLDMYFNVVRGIERFWSAMETIPNYECRKRQDVLGPRRRPRFEEAVKAETLYWGLIALLLFICAALRQG